MAFEPKKQTERRCIVTGKILPKDDLLRFVKTPESFLVPDFNHKLPGRGIYVVNSKQALEKALKQNLFIKSIHQHLKIGDDFLEMVSKLLYQKGLESLNLARKAGALVTGFEKVKAALLKDKVAFIVEAKDAGDDGREKIEKLSQHVEILKVYAVFDLETALDKVNTVHIAVLKSNIADMVYKNLKKYQTFSDQ